MNKFLSCLALSAMVSVCAYGQSGTNSPYSQYGLGDLSDQGVGINKAMSGVGLAFRKGNEVNTVNPASYSAVDSLSMIVDAGSTRDVDFGLNDIGPCVEENALVTLTCSEEVTGHGMLNHALRSARNTERAIHHVNRTLTS